MDKVSRANTTILAYPVTCVYSNGSIQSEEGLGVAEALPPQLPDPAESSGSGGPGPIELGPTDQRSSDDGGDEAPEGQLEEIKRPKEDWWNKSPYAGKQGKFERDGWYLKTATLPESLHYVRHDYDFVPIIKNKVRRLTNAIAPKTVEYLPDFIKNKVQRLTNEFAPKTVTYFPDLYAHLKLKAALIPRDELMRSQLRAHAQQLILQKEIHPRWAERGFVGSITLAMVPDDEEIQAHVWERSPANESRKAFLSGEGEVYTRFKWVAKWTVFALAAGWITSRQITLRFLQRMLRRAGIVVKCTVLSFLMYVCHLYTEIMAVVPMSFVALLDDTLRKPAKQRGSILMAITTSCVAWLVASRK